MVAAFEDLLDELRVAHAQAMQKVVRQNEALAAELHRLNFSSDVLRDDTVNSTVVEFPSKTQAQASGGRCCKGADAKINERSARQLMPEPSHRSPAPEALSPPFDSPTRLMLSEESTTRDTVRFQVEQAPVDGCDGLVASGEEIEIRSMREGSGDCSPQSRRRSMDPSHEGSMGSLSKRITRSLRMIKAGFGRRHSSSSTSSILKSLGITMAGHQPQGIRDPDRVRWSSDKLLQVVKDTAHKNISSVLLNGPGANNSNEPSPSSLPMTWKTGHVPTETSRKKPSWAEWLRLVTASFAFEAACILIIIVHAVAVGIEVSAAATGSEQPGGLQALEAFILTWYSLEFALRVWADRCARNIWWNSFDFAMLVVCAGDFAINLRSSDGTSPSSNYSVMRFLRFMRVARLLKMVKIGKMVNSYFLVFSKMTFCLRQSLPSLLSSCVVIAVFTYICAVILTQAATLHKDGKDDFSELRPGIEEHYGSLDRTFYSLIKAALNGQSWGQLMEPLTYVGSAFTTVFVFYVVVTLLCLLNVVQGVFVDSALQSTAHYKDLMVAEAQRRRVIFLAHLREVFHEIDTDSSGYITVQEFEACLTTPGGRAFFEVMGLSTVEAYDLFKLIDADGSHSVDIDEFCHGCLRFMGEAKNFDMQCIITENRQLLHKWHTFIENYESCIRTCLKQAVEASLQQCLLPKQDMSENFQAPSTCPTSGGFGASGPDRLMTPERSDTPSPLEQATATVSRLQEVQLPVPYIRSSSTTWQEAAPQRVDEHMDPPKGCILRMQGGFPQSQSAGGAILPPRQRQKL